MSKWVLGGSTFDFNPNKDSNWVYEEVMAEQHVIGSNNSYLQSDGFKAAVREVAGLTQSTTFRNALQALYLARNNVTLTDHRGDSDTVRISKLEWEEVLDVAHLNTCWTYKMQLRKR